MMKIIKISNPLLLSFILVPLIFVTAENINGGIEPSLPKHDLYQQHSARRMLQIATTTRAANVSRNSTTNATRATTTAARAAAEPPLWQSIYTVLIVFFMFVVLATEYFQPECVMLGALTILMCSGFLPTTNALIGFSNEGMLTVMSLMAFSQGLESAGALEILRVMLEWGTGPKTTIQFVLLRLTIISGSISAFLNNTPVVAFFIPVLQEFCAKYGFSTAEVMLPLSYAVILGGTVTTIGTSTNLVATGLYAARLNAQLRTTRYTANNVLGLFEMGQIGLPVLFAGIAYIVLVSPLLFKGRRVKPWAPEYLKTYTLELRVGEGCWLAKKSIVSSGLLNLSATIISHISIDEQNAAGTDDQSNGKLHASHVLSPSSLDMDREIKVGDVLVFRAEVHMLPELLRYHNLDFNILKDGCDDLFGHLKGKNDYYHMVYIDERRLAEVVVGVKSPLIGRRIDLSLRQDVKAFPVAVHRHGVPVLHHRDVTLQAGDALLVLTNDSFFSKYSRDSTFSVVKLVANYSQQRHKYTPILGSITLVLMIVLSQVLNEPQYGNISILKTALCGMMFMAMTGCASQVNMRNGAKIDLLIMIAVGFGLSEALTISGGAKMVANWIVQSAQGNMVGLVAGTYFVVVLFNAAVTNNAAVSIFFPIAWEVAVQAKVDFYPILLTLMFAGSADFSTPYGYQTNLMVYEPGGYNFMDYIKFGGPLQIVSGISTVAIVFSLSYWWVYAIAFAVASIAVVSFYFCVGAEQRTSTKVDLSVDTSMPPPHDLEKGNASSDIVAFGQDRHSLEKPNNNQEAATDSDHKPSDDVPKLSSSIKGTSESLLTGSA